MNSPALIPYFLQRRRVLIFLVESMNSFPSRFTESHTLQRPCYRSILDKSPEAIDEAEDLRSSSDMKGFCAPGLLVFHECLALRILAVDGQSETDIYRFLRP